MDKLIEKVIIEGAEFEIIKKMQQYMLGIKQRQIMKMLTLLNFFRKDKNK